MSKETPISSALTLDWYFLLELRIETYQEKGAKLETMNYLPLIADDLEIQTDLPTLINDGRMTVLLRVATTENGMKQCGLRLAVSMLGRFSLSHNLRDVEPIVISALDILYGAIRETVMTLSARTPMQPTMLPVIDFQSYVRRAAPLTSGKARSPKVSKQ